MKNQIIYVIVFVLIAILFYWLGYSRKVIYCETEYLNPRDTSSLSSYKVNKVAPISSIKAQILHENYNRFVSCKLSAGASSLLSFPIVIDSAKRDLSNIFSQTDYKDLLVYPGISLDSITNKPFFTLIFIGRNKNDSLMIQMAAGTSRRPNQSPNLIQDDNRPCKPCNVRNSPFE